MIPFLAIFIVLVACVIGGIGAVLLKLGSTGSLHPLQVIKNYRLVGGLFLYGLATIMFIPALKMGDLSILYPLTSTTQIWVVIFSLVILKENINAWKWLGVVAIVAGTTLISLGG